MTPGNHAEDFGERLDRFQYAGINAKSGQAWRAKGLIPSTSDKGTSLYELTDLILSQTNTRVQELITKYTREDLPDPALMLSLQNKIASGSNLFAVQKNYEGAFTLDVYFDSNSPGSALDGAFVNPGFGQLES